MQRQSRFWLTRMLVLVPILAVASDGRATEPKAKGCHPSCNPKMTAATANLAAAAPATSPAAPVITASAAPATTATHDGARDFDFFYGRWTAHNRRLVDRLVGSHEWKEFDATVECWPRLDGSGNIDEYHTDFWPGFVGMTVRAFEPKAQQWAIYWVDNRNGKLDSGVFGSFDGDVGVFGGTDVLRGRTVLVRYTWRRGPPPHWEQAFSGDAGLTWETNWTMDFTRLP